MTAHQIIATRKTSTGIDAACLAPYKANPFNPTTDLISMADLVKHHDRQQGFFVQIEDGTKIDCTRMVHPETGEPQLAALDTAGVDQLLHLPDLPEH